MVGLSGDVVLPVGELRGLGAGLAGPAQIPLHGVVQLPDGEDSKLRLSFVPQAGVLGIDVCRGREGGSRDSS